MKTAARAVESGVRAPPSSLTSDCDVPPLTGKPPPSPANRFDAASARFSWLASNRPPCFAATSGQSRPFRPRRGESRPGPVVASRSNHSSKRQELSAKGFPAARSQSFSRHASPSESTDAAMMPPITTKSATGLCFRKIFPRISSASAMPPNDK